MKSEDDCGQQVRLSAELGVRPVAWVLIECGTGKQALSWEFDFTGRFDHRPLYVIPKEWALVTSNELERLRAFVSELADCRGGMVSGNDLAARASALLTPNTK